MNFFLIHHFKVKYISITWPHIFTTLNMSTTHHKFTNSSHYKFTNTAYISITYFSLIFEIHHFTHQTYSFHHKTTFDVCLFSPSHTPPKWVLVIKVFTRVTRGFRFVTFWICVCKSSFGFSFTICCQEFTSSSAAQVVQLSVRSMFKRKKKSLLGTKDLRIV